MGNCFGKEPEEPQASNKTYPEINFNNIRNPVNTQKILSSYLNSSKTLPIQMQEDSKRHGQV